LRLPNTRVSACNTNNPLGNYEQLQGLNKKPLQLKPVIVRVDRVAM
jgi:hypothetical protein